VARRADRVAEIVQAIEESQQIVIADVEE